MKIEQIFIQFSSTIFNEICLVILTLFYVYS